MGGWGLLGDSVLNCLQALVDKLGIMTELTLVIIPTWSSRSQTIFKRRMGRIRALPSLNSHYLLQILLWGMQVEPSGSQTRRGTTRAPPTCCACWATSAWWGSAGCTPSSGTSTPPWRPCTPSTPSSGGTSTLTRSQVRVLDLPLTLALCWRLCTCRPLPADIPVHEDHCCVGVFVTCTDCRGACP